MTWEGGTKENDNTHVYIHTQTHTHTTSHRQTHTQRHRQVQVIWVRKNNQRDRKRDRTWGVNAPAIIKQEVKSLLCEVFKDAQPKRATQPFYVIRWHLIKVTLLSIHFIKILLASFLNNVTEVLPSCPWETSLLSETAVCSCCHSTQSSRNRAHSGQTLRCTQSHK